MRIGIIGMGKMGRSLANGLAAKGFEVMALARKSAEQAPLKGVQVMETYSNVLESDAVLLCVKPKDMGALAHELKTEMDASNLHPLLISIAAAYPFSMLEEQMAGERVARAMPNLAVQCGEALTAFSLGQHAGEQDAQKIKQIFDALGGSVQVKEESLNAVTVLSGSGPAYLFYFCRQLEKGGVRMGLERPLASQLARRTLIGAAALMREHDQPFEEWIKQIATPGGITEAALKRAEELNVPSCLQEMCSAALSRAEGIEKDTEKSRRGKNEGVA